MKSSIQLSPAWQVRRGSAYLMIIQISMLLSLIGLAAITIARVELRTAQVSGDQAASRLYARAAIDKGLFMIEQDQAGWRTTFAAKSVIVKQTIGIGTFSLDADDPVDSVIDDDPADPLVLVGTGEQGSARYMLRVMLQPDGSAMTITPGSWRRVVN